MRLLRWSSWRHEPVFKRNLNLLGHPNDVLITTMELTPEQENAVKQLRDRVGDKLPAFWSSDHELVRWLIARRFDVSKAEAMILKSLDWRREWDVDSILDWTPPEVLIKYYPVGLSGFDKEGSPVWIVPYGHCDMRGLLQSCSKRDYIRYTFKSLEQSSEIMERKSKGRDVPVTRQSCIFDLDNFSIWHITWKPAVEVVIQLIQMYEANYPELLKFAYVINAPKIFTTAYALVKPFLDDITITKIKIFGRTGWQEVILKEMDASELPVHWGGTMCDPNGDTKCSSKICMGGQVPKSFYLKIRKENSNSLKRDHLKSFVLPNTGKKIIEIDATHPGTELRWEFQSDDFDVGFGINYVSSSGEEVVIVPTQRVNSHLVPEEGYIICSDPGKYKIMFDNEFSYLRSKKLYYNLELHPPSEHTKL